MCVVSWCDCVRELWEGEICGMKWKFGGGSSHKTSLKDIHVMIE